MGLKSGDKVLIIDWLKFKLPDNFEGTLADAFRLLATHMEAPTDKIKPTGKSINTMKAFVEAVTNGNKALGAVQVSELIPKGDKLEWKKLPTGVVYGS